jgi:hypothetical protein
MGFALDYPVLLHRWARAGVMQLRRRHGMVVLDLHGLHRRSEPVAAVASLDNAGPLAIGRCPRTLGNGLRALPPFLQGVRIASQLRASLLGLCVIHYARHAPRLNPAALRLPGGSSAPLFRRINCWARDPFRKNYLRVK